MICASKTSHFACAALQEAVAIDAEGTKQSVRAFTIDILTMSVTTDMDIYVYVFDIKKLGQQARWF